MAELLAANQITIAKVLDGEQGIPGEKGADGKSSYFHIKYSSVANPTSSSQMTETPSTYIGTYVDFTEADSTDPTKYTWSRFEGIQGEKGEQGIPGIGQDGRTSYLHIAYATSADGSEGFSISESANKTYIGQYTDFISTDSTDPTKYAWTKIKGEMSAEQLAQLNQASTDASQAKSNASTAKTDAGNALSTANSANSKIDNLEIGGRNLFLNTGKTVSNNNYKTSEYAPANGPLKAGETYTATICVTPAENLTEIGVHFSLGYIAPVYLYPKGTGKQVISGTFTMEYYDGKTPDVHPSYAYAQLYRFPNDGTVTGNTTIHWFKIEKGNKATDWTPAPEDVDAGINDVDSKINNVTGNIYAPGSTLLDGSKINDGSLSINQMDDTVAGTYSDPSTKKGIMEWKNDALHIKSVDSNAQNTYETVIGGDGIKFNWNGAETASINQDELRINKTVVINAMEVGNWSWAIHPTTGNLMVKWNGGE